MYKSEDEDDPKVNKSYLGLHHKRYWINLFPIQIQAKDHETSAPASFIIANMMFVFIILLAILFRRTGGY